MAVVSMKRVVLVVTLLAAVILMVVFGFTWDSQADRIATLVSALAAVGSIGVAIWGTLSTWSRSGAGAAEKDPTAARINRLSSSQQEDGWYPAPGRRERPKVRLRFVLAVFPAALVAGAALGAADLSWGPLAAFHRYQMAWHNIGVLAFAGAVVAGFTRPPMRRLGFAASLVVTAGWLILESDRLRPGEVDTASWALAKTEDVGWLPYVLILLLALAWLVLREAPPTSLWLALLAPAALFVTSNFARSIVGAVETVANTQQHGYGLTFADVLLNSASLATAIAVVSWVSVRVYGARMDAAA